MKALGAIGVFQIVTTVLFIALGAAILVRAAARGAPWGSYLVGGLFAAYGVYRAGFVVRSLSGGEKRR